MLERLRQRIQEKQDHYDARTVLLVALGDSVTQGYGANNEILHEEVYHARLQRMLQQRFPLSTFSVVNSGVAGDSAPGALGRLGRDVISHQPDLVTVAFGLNDSCAGQENLPAFAAALEQIVRRIRRGTDAEVILLTPTFMTSRDNDRIAPEHRAAGYGPRFIEIQTTGVLAAFAQAVRDVGSRVGAPVADVYARWQGLAERGADTTAMLSNGLNHPTGEAHRLAAEAVFEVVVPETRG